MTRAGYCSECSANVWLGPDGSCSNGHPASSVSNVYEVGPAAGAPIGAPSPAPKSNAGVIIAIVIGAVLALVMLCGILSAIAVPVFLNASSNAQLKSCQANQRTVIGGYQTYAAMQDGDVYAPADWDELMGMLVPDYLKVEPKCPADGVYSAADDGFGGVSVQCSIHGSVDY
jgi:hypothetical protein